MGLGVLLVIGALDSSALFEQVKPSVVQVQVLSVSGELRGVGSGFVASEDGLLVTNHHVIEGASQLRAVFGTGEKRDVLGVLVDDVEHDIAVIRVAGSTTPLKLSPAAATGVGDEVMLVGSPFGLDFTVTLGTVAKYRPDGLPPEMLELIGDDSVVSKKPTLQLSAASGSGNSGGPVLNAKGEVIGIVRANIGGQSTFTFAVPAESVLAALSDAKTATLKDPGGSAGGSVGGSGNRFVNLAISAVAFAALAVFYWRVRKR